MKQTKRILSIKVERLVDDSPDTSWLGEYSSTPEGDYSIDRAHSEDCQRLEENHETAVNQIERVISYLNNIRQSIGNDSENPLYWTIDESIDLCADLQDSLVECDCGKHGDMGRNEYRYFNTSGNYKGEPIEDIRKYTRQDYARMESLNRGDWYFLGVVAKAEVSIGGTIQRIRSGGLWGIESDSEKSYIAEEESNQLAELKTILGEMGFSKRAISAATRESLAA